MQQLTHHFSLTLQSFDFILVETGRDPVHAACEITGGGATQRMLCEITPHTWSWVSSPPHTDHRLIPGSVCKCNQIFDDNDDINVAFQFILELFNLASG